MRREYPQALSCPLDEIEWFGQCRTMERSPNIAALAARLADPARARMVLALMDGRALTVSELGAVAGLGKASASEHATRLLAAGLVRADRQGRHKYLRLVGSQVALLIETMMTVAAPPMPPPRPIHTGLSAPALREARVCYNHLAGSLGVQLYRSLSARGYLAHMADGLTLTPEGRLFALSLGLTEADLAPGRTPLCRDCLDWSERQSHLGGRLGRLLLTRFHKLGWLRRPDQGRALLITPPGRASFARSFPDLPLSDGLPA